MASAAIDPSRLTHLKAVRDAAMAAHAKAQAVVSGLSAERTKLQRELEALRFLENRTMEEIQHKRDRTAEIDRRLPELENLIQQARAIAEAQHEKLEAAAALWQRCSEFLGAAA